MTGQTYRICTRCVMDTTDEQVRFDGSGHCNHCREYFDTVKKTPKSTRPGKSSLETVIETIRKEGEGKEFDCIIGISGGVDSTYLAYLVKRVFHLKPLAVHLDNGWDSKLAVKNIGNILRKLDIELYTYVIDWEEFRRLQIAYFKASVIDIEAITDHAINAVLYRAAFDNKVKFILKGFNKVTEKIMPKSWTFNKNDARNILDINKKAGNQALSSFPLLGIEKLKHFEKAHRIRTIFPYRYMDFDKEKAKSVISGELGWEDYGGKHYESVFTRFYQGYILPRKFNVDKRKAHYSNLICAGSMTREQALKALEEPPYDEKLVKEDYEYVTKKLGFSEEEFENIMRQPARSHFDYKTDMHSKIYKKYLSPTNPVVALVKKFSAG